VCSKLLCENGRNFGASAATWFNATSNGAWVQRGPTVREHWRSQTDGLVLWNHCIGTWHRYPPGRTLPARTDAGAMSNLVAKMAAPLGSDLGRPKDLPFRRSRVMDVVYRGGYSKPHEILQAKERDKALLVERRGRYHRFFQ
jgi:hypothetical protein